MSAVSVSSIVHAAQPISDIFEAKLLEDIDTSFVENASLTWDTSSFNNDSWPTRQETVIKKTAEGVYKMLIQRSHRGSLLQLLFSLVARRHPFCKLSPRGATSACEGILRGGSAGCCSRSAWVVFVVLSYWRPHRILPFLFRLVSLECSPLCLQIRHKYSLYCSELVEVEVLSQWEMNKQLLGHELCRTRNLLMYLLGHKV